MILNGSTKTVGDYKKKSTKYDRIMDFFCLFLNSSNFHLVHVVFIEVSLNLKVNIQVRLSTLCRGL